MGLWDRVSAAVAGFRAAGNYPAEHDYWYEPLGLKTGAGISVTPDIALKASALFSCVKVLAETVASLPLQMYRDLPNEGREPVPEHPLDEVIRRQPNDLNTAIEFWEFMVLHACLRGTSYAEIIPGSRGAVDQLKPLHKDLVKPELLTNGRYRFEVRDPTTGVTRRLTQDEVFRLPGLSSNGIEGIPVVDYAAEAIGLGMAADQYASRVFSNNVNVGLIITHPGKLSEEGQRKYIDQFMARLAGVSNAHRPILLQEGQKAEKLGQTAHEAQLIEARKWQILEIARFFRIPPHMLGISEGATHANVEEQSRNFVTYTLRPWVRRIEQAIWRDLITTRGYSAKFSLEGLLRGNAQARADYYSKALGSGGSPGWMTPNEIRALEGMNPITGGDKLPVQVNPGAAPAEEPAALPPPQDKPQAALPAPATSAPVSSIDERAGTMVRKEVTALRKAAMRHAGDMASWRAYAEAFYRSQISDVTKRFGVPYDVAASYCTARVTQCRAARSANAAIDHLEAKGAGELAGALRS